jgi:hypothetical protein
MKRQPNYDILLRSLATCLIFAILIGIAHRPPSPGKYLPTAVGEPARDRVPLKLVETSTPESTPTSRHDETGLARPSSRPAPDRLEVAPVVASAPPVVPSGLHTTDEIEAAADQARPASH